LNATNATAPQGDLGNAAPIDVSVVVPVYGCKGCLEELVERVGATLTGEGLSFEVILIDDQSPDRAWSRIEELSDSHRAVRGLRLSRNFGQHAAISAGLASARGGRVVVMDCDLQDVPEAIAPMLAAMEEGVEVVLGQRAERQDGWFKRTGSIAFYRTLGWLTDRFLPLLVRWTGFNTVKIVVPHARRSEGRSGYTLGALLRMATRIALSFSDKPLRLVMTGALVIAAGAAAIAAFAVYRYSAGDIRVAGFTSIVASIWLVGSLLMGSIGVLGLYLGKVHGESKGRPQYLVWQDTREQRQ
jgi:dolichol-phosphate mannosyltransferase